MCSEQVIGLGHRTLKMKFTYKDLNYTDCFGIEGEYVSDNIILQSVLPGGDLFDTVVEHFEAPDEPMTLSE